MKAYVKALALAAFVAGCATTSDSVQSVAWIRPATPEELRAICGNRPVVGCQFRESGVCYIVAMDLGGDTLNTLGHELKHCFDGAWHLSGISQSRVRK